MKGAQQVLEGEGRRKEGMEPEEKGFLHPSVRGLTALRPGHLGPHQLDTAHLQAVGSLALFAQTQERG